MSVLDAKILQSFTGDSEDESLLKSIGRRSFAAQAVEEISVIRSDGTYEIAYTNLIYPDIPDTDYDAYRFSSAITHLEQLGLVKIDYNRCLFEEDYSAFNDCVEEIIETMSIDSDNIIIRKGVAVLTPIGQDFLEVCTESNNQISNATM